MSPEYVIQVIQEISAMLEPSVQYAWQLAVRESYMIGIRGLFWLIIGLTATYFGVKMVRLATKMSESNQYGYSSDKEMTYWVAGVLMVIMGVIISATGLNVALTYLMNPEFRAVMLLLGK